MDNSKCLPRKKKLVVCNLMQLQSNFHFKMDTYLYVNFLSKFIRPGDPSAAAKVGQNFCHRNAVKCGFVCTFFGNAVVNVKMHSVKYNEPHDSLFFGVPTLE